MVALKHTLGHVPNKLNANMYMHVKEVIMSINATCIWVYDLYISP
jgi:hypothetical protein